jgi:hypothetical protein
MYWLPDRPTFELLTQSPSFNPNKQIMKTLKLLVASLLLLLAVAAHAQVSVTVNIGSPPQWGPVGNDEVRYYYLPAIETYYDVHSSMFIFYSGGVWIHRANLPSRHRHYDLYSGYKVVMTGYHGGSPYDDFHSHKTKYAKGYNGGSQQTIGEHPGKGNASKKSGAPRGAKKNGRKKH